MDEWGVLTEATIDAIHVASEKKEIRIDVTCAWQGKAKKQIIATGVDDFVVNEMRLSNIIDRVNKFDVSDGREGEVARRLFFMMRGREPESHELQWPALIEKLDCIRSGVLSLIEVEPVYGATVTILAKSFLLE